MGRIALFVTLVALGIAAVVGLSSGSSNDSSLLNSLSPTPEDMKLKYQEKNGQMQPQNPQAQPEDAPQEATGPATVEEPVTATQAAILTAKGEIVINLSFADAPNTVRNFVNKVKSGFYKGLTFHRVEDWVIQGGDPKGDGTGGGNMPVEFNSKPFGVGAVGVASRGDGRMQNDAQFFITKQDASWLNGKYTNFGQVDKGMDVVGKIAMGDKIINIMLK